MIQETLQQLIHLSHEIAREERGLVILGEGNTSADCGDGTFWIKASGTQLATSDEHGFSRVNMNYMLDLIKAETISDEQIEKELINALVDKSHKKPSVETFFHAICIHEAGVKFIVHTHAVSVNQILCSQLGVKPFLGHIFPDGIVVCGAKPAILPYIDPGFALSKAFQRSLNDYMDKYGIAPKMMLMENHGVVALGQSAREAENITLMADKWAKVILGTYALGGPKHLSEENVRRIDTRLDEYYRRQELAPKN